ncbi:hypothetical protein AGLY_005976, partial [Aphis glycines]
MVKHVKHIPNNVITIKLSFNIDGLSLSKNSKTQFFQLVFTIVIKTNLNEYFKPFIIELQNFLTCGIKIENKQIRFEIVHIIADPPVKGFLLNVKNHKGYFSCNSCEVEGDYKGKRVCFLGSSILSRSNDSFKSKSNPEYHKDGVSPLIELPIDVTNTVVLDYMHCVCRGVMKRLLEKLVPSEFARLPSSIDDHKYWKAKEFWEILLYTGLYQFEYYAQIKLINENISNFGTIYYNQITINSKNYYNNPKDQCIILDDGSNAIIKNIYKPNSEIHNTIKLSVVKILTINDLFIKPVPSRLLMVFINVFFSKLVNDQAVVISLCHN